MTRRAFDKIAAGLQEAAAIARGEVTPVRLYIPAEIDVKAIRRKLKLSQEDFASTFGFTLPQIRNWEQGRARPLGALRAYLLIISRDSKMVELLLRNGRVAA
ncbi:MAG TPA: helix-turn-helix domain-containing protein [Beijerinckiaceae bacterium]|nr:helix-turn-helix domain-containing protein [Beijerinckiaceae bacterium]